MVCLFCFIFLFYNLIVINVDFLIRDKYEGSVDTSGVFTAPDSGRYEVMFTGLLKSYNGNRVWSTLYKVRNVGVLQQD